LVSSLRLALTVQDSIQSCLLSDIDPQFLEMVRKAPVDQVPNPPVFPAEPVPEAKISEFAREIVCDGASRVNGRE
jgi:hypothetical protein